MGDQQGSFDLVHLPHEGPISSLIVVDLYGDLGEAPGVIARYPLSRRAGRKLHSPILVKGRTLRIRVGIQSIDQPAECYFHFVTPVVEAGDLNRLCRFAVAARVAAIDTSSAATAAQPDCAGRGIGRVSWVTQPQIMSILTK